MKTPGISRFSDPSLLILTSLANGDKHGYAMMDDIERLTNARLGPGTLYGALSRLESWGLIEPLAAEERRRPYRLTDAGRAYLSAELAALRDLSLLGLQRLEARV